MTIEIANLTDTRARIAAILKEINVAVGTLLNINVAGAPVIAGTQYGDARPVWGVVFTEAAPEVAGISEASQVFTAVITLKLGKSTAGTKGSLELQNDTWTPFTLSYFKGTPVLQSAAYQAEPDDLMETDITLSQMGLMVDDEIGAEFRLTLPFNLNVPVRF